MKARLIIDYVEIDIAKLVEIQEKQDCVRLLQIIE